MRLGNNADTHTGTCTAPESETESNATGSRRQFMRTTAGAAVGVAGLTATSGTAVAGGDNGSAEAPHDYPLVSTRDHYEISWWGSVQQADGHNAYDYDIEGNWGKYDDAREIAMFVHGWNQDDGDDQDIDSAYTCELSLDRNDYDAFNVGFSWDSDKGGGLDQGWYEATEIADRNGPKLANWVWNTDRPIRLVGHSLGARVVLSALETLDYWGATDAVRSATLLGGAADDQSVSTEERYGTAIESVTGQFDNYYKTDDQVLSWAYSLGEFDTAVGEQGIEDGKTPPSNYEDHDVTNTVPDHGSYYEPGDGCMPTVANDFQS